MVLIRLNRGLPLWHLDLSGHPSKTLNFQDWIETSNCSLSVDVNDSSDGDIQTDDNSIIPESGSLIHLIAILFSFCIIDA